MKDLAALFFVEPSRSGASTAHNGRTGKEAATAKQLEMIT